MTLPAPDPVVTEETAPYWEATSEHRLVLPQCRTCRSFVWYPRGFCPRCASFDVDWVEVAGTGTVHSFSIPRRGQGAYAEVAPYVVAYVELDVPDGDGPRMITNVVDCDPEGIAIGDRVEVVFHDTASGHALPRFRPAT